MNKFIFCDLALWPHFLELCEIARVFKSENKNVHFISSYNPILGNPDNPLNFGISKFFTKRRLEKINIHLNLNGINAYSIYGHKKIDPNVYKKINENKSLNQAIYGTFAEIINDGLFSENQPLYKSFKKKTFFQLASIYEILYKTLKNGNFDEVVVWNGRRITSYFVADISKSLGIKVSSIISSQISGKYAYKKNWSDVNSIFEFTKRIKYLKSQYLKKGFSKEDIKLSNLYYQRASGMIKKPSSFSSYGFYNYSDGYKSNNEIKDKCNSLKSKGIKIISIFTGTFLEYASLPGYTDDSLFNNHYEALDFLLNTMHPKNVFFILRFHPNQFNLLFNENKRLQKIIFKASKLKNFLVIKPNSETSSYELIELSDKVISIGSSIGIEALKMDKNVMFIGRNWFESIESLYKPKVLQDILMFIISPNKKNLNKNRDTVLFTKALFDSDHLSFKYYHASNDKKFKTNQIFNKYFDHVMCIFSIKCSIFSKIIYRLKYRFLRKRNL